MVNTGRPSKGCLTCRRRRIKCDETKPTCARCSRMKAECTWQDDWSSMVRHQEQWAQKKVVQRVERVQHLRNERARQVPRVSAYLPNVALFPRQPQLGPEMYVVDRFYIDYAFTAATCPFLYHAEPLYHSSKTPSCLHSVVPAVALASAAKRLHRHDLMGAANQHYGMALRKLSDSIADTAYAKHDATLLTVFLLGVYELLSIDRNPGMSSPWESHAIGRLAILRLRGREQLYSQAGRNLFIILYQEQLIASFVGDKDVLGECTTWMREVFPPSPIVSMMLLMHEVSLFLKEMKRVLRDEEQDATELISLLDRGIGLDEMLVDLIQVFYTGQTGDSVTMKYFAKATEDALLEKEKLSERGEKVHQRVVSDKRSMRRSSARTLPPGNKPFPGPASRRQSHIPPDIDKASNTKTEQRTDDTPPGEQASSPPWMEQSDREEEVKQYLSITRALATNSLRAALIHLLEALLEVSSHVHPSAPSNHKYQSRIPNLRADWCSRIERFANEICSDAPYALGTRDYRGRPVDNPIGGMAFRTCLLLWPLRTALASSRTSLNCKKRIVKRLKNISTTVGMGMAAHMLSTQKDVIPNGGDGDEDPDDNEFGDRPVLQGDSALNDHLSWALGKH